MRTKSHRVCTFPGCEAPYLASGYCTGHRKQLLKGRELTPIRPIGSPEERLWSRVEKTDGCWNYTGATFNGYGRISMKGRAAYLAHRAAWEFTNGPIPDGMTIDHLCRNKRCCNPAHMEVVTFEENGRRANENWQRMRAAGVRQLKLTEAEAREILASREPTRVLRKRYGVSANTVRNIRSGRRWSHLEARDGA